MWTKATGKLNFPHLSAFAPGFLSGAHCRADTGAHSLCSPQCAAFSTTPRQETQDRESSERCEIPSASWTLAFACGRGGLSLRISMAPAGPQRASGPVICLVKLHWDWKHHARHRLLKMTMILCEAAALFDGGSGAATIE